MKMIKFILKKIIIVEVMLIILFFTKNLFGISIPIINLIISTGLKYLTPIAIISCVLYIIISILNFKIVEIAIFLILGALILYYASN